MSGKVRVYQVARDLGVDNKSLVALFQSVGVTDVKNHMSAVAPEAVDRVKRQLARQGGEKAVEEQIRHGVVKRRTRKVATEAPPASAAAAASAPAASAPAAAPVPAAVPAAAPPPAAAPSAPAAAPSAPAAAPSAPAAASPPSAPAAAPSAPAAAAPEPSAPAAAPAPVPEPPAAAAAAAPAEPAPAAPAPAGADAAARPSTAPRTGIDVWEGRPGVPRPTPPRSAGPRRVQYDAKTGGPGGGGPGGGHRGRPMMGGRMGRGPRRGIGSFAPRRGGGGSVTQERSAHKKVVKIEESISVQALAAKISAKSGEVLMKLLSLGMTGVNINTTLDADTAKIVGQEFGWDIEDVAVSEAEAIVKAQGQESDEEDAGRVARAPIVTIMGHVDHGKTSLLDKIRSGNVTSGEAGGITQHIGAYSVTTKKGRIAFLDTPGHAAFSSMRARGADATDIVILVVAADDGVKPQTKEAISHAKAAKVPIIVAINKIDREGSQPERVRRQLGELDLVPEEWGGDTLFTEVSAMTGEGIDQLLDTVLLQAEVMELKANPDRPASGVVVESKLDRGRGPVATVMVTEGTLRRGDVVLAGGAFGKIRAIVDDLGKNIKEAGPATPVSVIGLGEVPSPGDPVHWVKNVKDAQEIAEGRRTKERRSLMSTTIKVSLDDLAQAMHEANQLECKLIIKGDVQGSVEALQQSLVDLSGDKVRVTMVHSGVGAITEGDVNLAAAAKAVIIGFNVGPAGKARSLAQKEGIEIRNYSIIYEVIDDVRNSMEGMLAPIYEEQALGEAEVRQVFKITKAGIIAGCMIVKGMVRRSAHVRLVRAGEQIFEGKLDSLKRFKDDVKEVKEGFDCGMSLDGHSDVAEGDIIQAYELKEVPQTLD
ncbi:MAG: translation initiation factor IF-2 [Polyangiaceae bacterium]|nr:translation initiation factor IF-2 [Polyangiaceae bacterium]